MTKRAILYARVSGDDRQNVTSSIAAQLDECRKYAMQRGYIIVEEVSEDPNRHTSGADWLPELDRLIRLAPGGTYNTIVCHKVDRISRDKNKFIVVNIEFAKHDISIEYAGQQFEDSPEGELMKDIVSGFAAYEKAIVSRRTHNGRLRSVKEGNVSTNGLGAPLGYDIVVQDGKRTLAINQQEAAVVRLIFDLYVMRGLSIGAVCDHLDEQAPAALVRSKATTNPKRPGQRWSRGMVAYILHNETYAGRWHYNKNRWTKHPKTGKRKLVPRPREEWIEVAVPAIVSDELFAAVNRRTQANRVQMGHQRKNFYALGGMIRCGHCGFAVTGITKVHGRPSMGERKYSYARYKCKARGNPRQYGFKCSLPEFKVDDVEQAVWGWIKSLLLEPAVLRQSIDEYQASQLERIQPQLAMLESSQARLGELEGQKERLIAAYTAGVLSLDELASQKSALDKQIADLGQAVAALRAEAEPMLLSAEHVETIEAIAAEVRTGAALVDNDKQAQRAIFQMLEVHVRLYHEDSAQSATGEEKRWADVSCTFGSEHLALAYNAT